MLDKERLERGAVTERLEHVAHIFGYVADAATYIGRYVLDGASAAEYHTNLHNAVNVLPPLSVIEREIEYLKELRKKV